MHIGSLPRFWSKGTQCRCRVECTSTHFHIIRLQNGAALVSPIVMERQDERLKRTFGVHMIWNVGHGISQHLLISDADRCHDLRDGSRFYAIKIPADFGLRTRAACPVHLANGNGTTAGGRPCPFQEVCHRLFTSKWLYFSL
ncbi:hypothetical protein D3C80_1714050 [compost metagenome]